MRQIERRGKSLILVVVRRCYRLYWYLVRPHKYGAKVFIENDGKYLFVRQGYGSGAWTLPGGGKSRHDADTVATARREVLEEVSLVLGDIRHLGTYETTKEYKFDHVDCYQATVTEPGTLQIDGWEILEARWFPKGAFPEPLSMIAKAAIAFENKASGNGI